MLAQLLHPRRPAMARVLAPSRRPHASSSSTACSRAAPPWAATTPPSGRRATPRRARHRGRVSHWQDRLRAGEFDPAVAALLQARGEKAARGESRGASAQRERLLEALVAQGSDAEVEAYRASSCTCCVCVVSVTNSHLLRARGRGARGGRAPLAGRRAGGAGRTAAARALCTTFL